MPFQDNYDLMEGWLAIICTFYCIIVYFSLAKYTSIMEDLTLKQKEGLGKYHWYSILNINPSLVSLSPLVYRSFEEIND